MSVIQLIRVSLTDHSYLNKLVIIGISPGPASYAAGRRPGAIPLDRTAATDRASGLPWRASVPAILLERIPARHPRSQSSILRPPGTPGLRASRPRAATRDPTRPQRCRQAGLRPPGVRASRPPLFDRIPASRAAKAASLPPPGAAGKRARMANGCNPAPGRRGHKREPGASRLLECMQALRSERIYPGNDNN
jgi:hypothetical protein